MTMSKESVKPIKRKLKEIKKRKRELEEVIYLVDEILQGATGA